MGIGKDPTAGDQPFTLEVPLDASGIEGFQPGGTAKVAVQTGAGVVQAQTVKFDEKGNAVARFDLPAKPSKLTVVVGPAEATDEELFGLQTIRVEVPLRLSKEPRLALQPIKIPPFYWFWWLRWCRTFTVRGRVLCPDGSPVPGAKVCAYDVDAWWWWSSKQLVGCDVTDATGAFEIKFRWCCGWWPWWWWRLRRWYLDPYLLERILPLLEREPHLPRIPLPDPAPDLEVFRRLMGGEQLPGPKLPERPAVPPGTVGPRVVPVQPPIIRPGAVPKAAAEVQAGTRAPVEIDPDMLASLREPLLAKLPRSPELEQLKLWPWWPWQPWWDCTPDIIFRVTQDCVQAGTVIYEETFGQAHWDIPTDFAINLTANAQACCLGGHDGDPEGACALITNVCDNPIDQIGGNPGALPTPAGYLSPDFVSIAGDRPYGGNVLIQGQMGSDVDYYEFQWSTDGVTWNDMPGTAVGDIPREYWIPSTNTFQWVSFLDTIDGRLVFESRQHYEATHDPGTWNVTRFWMAYNYLSLMNWLTRTPFINGLYHLRIKGYQLVNGHLSALQNLEFLPTCSVETPAELVVQIDNRLEGAASGHPMADPDHPCGPGTVHTCTLEPDTDFLAVRILRANGEVTEVSACGNVPVGPNDRLQVDFFANDPEGHLSFYTLQATYKENLARDMLALPGLTLTPLGGAPVPAAVQVGPTYAQARSANPPPQGGASAPNWRGGAIRLEVPAGGPNGAFPETCCYQLELRAHKRTIVDCDHSLWGHTNYSEYSFMIVV